MVQLIAIAEPVGKPVRTADFLQTPTGTAIFPASNAFMTHKNRSRPALDAPIRFSIFSSPGQAFRSIRFRLTLRSNHFYQSKAGAPSACRAHLATIAERSFTRNLSQHFVVIFHQELDPADSPAEPEHRLIRQGSPLRRHALGPAL
jgi:hypothetical protein